MCPCGNSPTRHVTWGHDPDVSDEAFVRNGQLFQAKSFLQVRSYRVGNRTALQSSIQCCNNVSPVTIDSSLSEFSHCAGETLIVLSRFKLAVDYTGT